MVPQICFLGGFGPLNMICLLRQSTVINTQSQRNRHPASQPATVTVSHQHTVTDMAASRIVQVDGGRLELSKSGQVGFH